MNKWLKLLGVFLGVSVSGASRALALMLLWNWFVTRLGMPAISFCESYGLLNIYTLLTTKYDVAAAESTKTAMEVFTSGILTSIMNAGITIALGYLTYIFL